METSDSLCGCRVSGAVHENPAVSFLFGLPGGLAVEIRPGKHKNVPAGIFLSDSRFFRALERNPIKWTQLLASPDFVSDKMRDQAKV